MLQDVKILLRTFAADESGASAIEYGVIAAGIAGVVVGAVNTVGSNMKAVFYDKISAAFTPSP